MDPNAPAANPDLPLSTGPEFAAPSQPSPPSPSPEVGQASADPSAAAPKKPRPRRGPPPAGVEERRVDMILTTSRLSDAHGHRLRRGQVVSVPERRVVQLTLSGKVRKASAGEREAALRRHGAAGRIA